jgi:hypothetical protein
LTKDIRATSGTRGEGAPGSRFAHPGYDRSARAWLESANSPSPNDLNLAKFSFQRETAPGLTFRAWAVCFAQPLGSPSADMRNKITNLLIVVVPRRTAGDG